MSKYPSFDVSQTLFQAREIKVAIVPVGVIPDHKFREYEALIRTFNRMELNEMSPDSTSAGMSLFSVLFWS